jgi:UDP-glucose 4-epimerase
MRPRRILVTGLSTYWGGRVAQALEQEEDVEAIVGVDANDPSVELERSEYVRVGHQHALLRRIVHAAEIDTVVDTRMVVDSTTTSPRLAHENNVIGTMNILAACSGPESPVRKFVFKSSAHWYGCEQDDPAYFTEDMDRPHPPRTSIEKDLVEAEAAVRSYADATPRATVTVLRFANGVGPTLRTAHTKLFGLPALPCILGFDPRYQFVHEDDIVGCLDFAVRQNVPGVFNCSGDGVLVLSEVADLLSKPLVPILPPWGTGIAAGVARRLGVQIPPEMLQQLKFGRGIDNRKLKAAGYSFRFTTREALQAHAEAMRLRPLLRGGDEPYRYEREVEEFLRRSPTVRTRPEPRWKRQNADVDNYDELEAAELIDLLPSLPRDDLESLGRHEAANARRPEVLAAIGRNLARTRPV